MQTTDRHDGTDHEGAATPTAGADTAEHIELVEERAKVAIADRTDGRVTVTTHTELHEETVHAELASHTVEVTRHPVDRTLAEGEAPPQPREEGGVTIVPVIEERLFVEKRLVLVEEVHLTRRTTQEAVDIPVTLRRQSASVDKQTAGPDAGDAPA